MFVAHLPSGYLVFRALPRAWRTRVALAGALIGSVLPDLDLVYFYLVDERRHAHHTYWSHIPFYWLVIALMGIPVVGVVRRSWLPAASALLAGVLAHLLLDTVAGGIFWLHPIRDVEVVLVHVPPRYSWWVWSFVLHWSFALELVVIAGAALLSRRSPRPSYALEGAREERLGDLERAAVLAREE